MKLSQETVAILKNFSTIHQNLQFMAGNVIKTKSTASDVFGSAIVAEEFPVNFAIYELGRFLSVISLFNDPDLEFGEKSVKIGDGKNAVNYVYADSSLIASPDYKKEITLPPVIASFELKQDQIAKLQKAASVLGVPTVSITAKNGMMNVVAHDKKNASSDKFTLDVGVTDASDFTVDLKLETLRFIQGDYDVDVTERVVCRFKNKAIDLTYLVAGDVSKA